MEKLTGTELPSVMALAFLGDAVHSLYIRKRLVAEGISKPGELNSRALEYVTAKRQSEALARIEYMFSEEEADIYRRARNSPHLRRPKSAAPADYARATGFEAVLGALFFTGDRDRLEQLLSRSFGD